MAAAKAAVAAAVSSIEKHDNEREPISPETEEISEDVPLRILDGPPALLDVPQHNGVRPVVKVGQVVQSLVTVVGVCNVKSGCRAGRWFIVKQGPRG